MFKLAAMSGLFIAQAANVALFLGYFPPPHHQPVKTRVSIKKIRDEANSILKKVRIALETSRELKDKITLAPFRDNVSEFSIQLGIVYQAQSKTSRLVSYIEQNVTKILSDKVTNEEAKRLLQSTRQLELDVGSEVKKIQDALKRVTT